MHTEVMDFIAKIKAEHPHFFKNKIVLEVGSLDLNGSPRQFFDDCLYTGIDLGEGNGVDAVCHVTDMPFENGGFDVIVSTEALEHDRRWNASLRKMYGLTKKDGLIIVTCAGPEREEHGTVNHSGADSPFTNDYYGNISMQDFRRVLDNMIGFSSYELRYCRGQQDLMFWGIKK